MVKNQKRTDNELVILSLKNPDYFAYLVNRYERKLLRYIMRISGVVKEDAEDILQDVFIKIYQNLNGFNPNLKFSSWAYRITHNQTISCHRKKKSRPKTVSFDLNNEFLESLADDLDLNRQMSLKETKRQVGKALADLDIKYREVLILRFLEEKNYREISDILKKPMGTVATLINRAKKEFREEIKKHV